MVLDKVTSATEFNHLNVRMIKDNGRYHREVVECGDYTRAAELNIPSEYTDLWAQEVIDAYEASIAGE